MTERDRLIELIGKELLDYASWDTEMALAGNYTMPSVEEVIADKILKDGWIRPPCKVGQTVYIVDEGDEGTEPYVLDIIVTAIGYDIAGFWITMNLPLGLKQSAHIGERSFGKTVFLTREEAEQALKGGAE